MYLFCCPFIIIAFISLMVLLLHIFITSLLKFMFFSTIYRINVHQDISAGILCFLLFEILNFSVTFSHWKWNKNDLLLFFLTCFLFKKNHYLLWTHPSLMTSITFILIFSAWITEMHQDLSGNKFSVCLNFHLLV